MNQALTIYLINRAMFFLNPDQIALINVMGEFPGLKNKIKHMSPL